jgi:hypothetical protein
MYFAALIAAILLGTLLLVSAYGELTKDARQIDTITKVGLPVNYLWGLAVCEIAGALGVFIGLYWYPRTVFQSCTGAQRTRKRRDLDSRPAATEQPRYPHGHSPRRTSPHA